MAIGLGKFATLVLLLASHGSVVSARFQNDIPRGTKLVFAGDAPPPNSLFPGPSEDDIFALAADTQPSDPVVVANAYLVSLRPGTSIAGRRSLDGAHAQFEKRALSHDIDYEVREEYHNADIFYGLSVNLKNHSDLETLQDFPEVKKVFPITMFSPPRPVGYEKFDPGKAVASEYGFNTSVTRSADYRIDYNNKLAGVDRMHGNGFTGKGIKLAVLDTGIDYRHPSLGGGFGPGKKVSFGRNYIDDGMGGPNDPIATCADGGHGTHVAGTIIGEDAKDQGFGLLGVAPEVEFGMYRVFGCGGDTSSDIIIKAMLDAAEDGAEILSLSLGSDSGFGSNNPFEEVVSSLKSQGVIVIAANGNAGAMGPYKTGNPAISVDAVAVASVDAARYPTTYTVKDNKGSSFRYGGLWPLTADFNVHIPPTDEEGCSDEVYATAADYAKERGWDLSRTALVLKHGSTCNPSAKTSVAGSYGFPTVIHWKPVKHPNPYDNGYGPVVGPYFAVWVDANDGPKLFAAAKADPDGYRLRFSDTRFRSAEIPSASFTSNFSSFGASWELDRFKPDIAAPGHLILSTWPLEQSGYAIISGTSMATPFVAGCYALLKSAHPNLSIDELNSLMYSTATPSKWWGDSSITHTLLHQGSGTINVWNAHNGGVLFDKTRFALGGTGEDVQQSFTFTNTLERRQTFQVAHSPAGLLQRVPYVDAPRDEWLELGWPSKAIYAGLSFDTPTTITLGPGESANISFTVTPPKVETKTLPSYSGFITLTSGRDVYAVSYFGVPYKFSEGEFLERTLESTLGANVPALGKVSFDASGSGTGRLAAPYESFNQSIPEVILFRFRTYQPLSGHRIDIVNHNTTFIPTIYGFDPDIKYDNLTTGDAPVLYDWGGVESLGLAFLGAEGGPLDYMGIWISGIWDPKTTEYLEGYKLPAGDYRLVLRALRFELDPSDPKNWDSYLTSILHLPSGWE